MVNERSGARLVDCGVKNVCANVQKLPVQKKYRGIVTLKLRIFYTHTCLYV